MCASHVTCRVPDLEMGSAAAPLLSADTGCLISCSPQCVLPSACGRGQLSLSLPVHSVGGALL
jgi:hypothetical protein